MDVAAGFDHSVAVTQTGDIYMFGYNIGIPSLFSLFSLLFFTQHLIFPFHFPSTFLFFHLDGQLGFGDTKDRTEPTKYNFFKDANITIKSIVCGQDTTGFLTGISPPPRTPPSPFSPSA